MRNEFSCANCLCGGAKFVPYRFAQLRTPALIWITAVCRFDSGPRPRQERAVIYRVKIYENSFRFISGLYEGCVLCVWLCVCSFVCQLIAHIQLACLYASLSVCLSHSKFDAPNKTCHSSHHTCKLLVAIGYQAWSTFGHRRQPLKIIFPTLYHSINWKIHSVII